MYNLWVEIRKLYRSKTTPNSFKFKKSKKFEINNYSFFIGNHNIIFNNMGKTFKYAYHGNNFRSIPRHAEEKIGDRRKERRALKDFTRLEILEETTYVKKLNPTKDHRNISYPRKYDSTALWDNTNANVTWVEENNNDRNSDCCKGTWSNYNKSADITLMLVDKSSENNVAYNIKRNSFDQHIDKIGKKQLSRRGEIGRMKLKHRNTKENTEFAC